MTKIFPIVVFLLGGCAASAFPQSEDEVKGIRRDLDAVRDSLKVIQNELETIKKLLQQRPAGAAQPQAFKEATISIDGAPVLGEKTAKVTLVEFSDYQCPFCKRNFEQTFPQIDKEYIKTGKVKYVFRAYPLESIHPAAFKASEAALCGGEQGKYWEMHEKLFTNQKALAPADLATYAKSVGVEEGKFKECLESGRSAAKIRDDMAEGRKAGVSGTPGFFLGLTQPNATTVKATKFISGAQPYANFKDAIDQLLAAN
jgi:protein-disulfide isomerase